MKKVMIVDDNEDLRKTVKWILDKEGYETILAENGDDCLKQINDLKIKPDLILLDIMMPGVPVAQVVEQLKDMRIVYLSAVTISQKDKEIMIQKENVLDFLAKPFEKAELVHLLKKYLGE